MSFIWTIIPNERKTILEIKYHSERECEFYFQHLKKLKLIKMTDCHNLQNLRSFQDQFDYFNDVIYGSSELDTDPDKLIKDMTKKFQQQQIEIEKLKPLKKENERFYNWAWGYLKFGFDEYDEPESFKNFNYKHFSHDRAETSHRYSDIINALHRGESTYDEQNEIINHLNSEWSNFVYPQNTLIKWIGDTDKNQLDWVFEYIKNNKNNIGIAWLPSTSIDKLDAIIATMDLWEEEDAKELFFHKMKRAWSQKKFRDKSDGKKAYSISMTEKTKQRLDALAKLKELNLNEVIEELIREEYNIHDW